MMTGNLLNRGKHSGTEGSKSGRAEQKKMVPCFFRSSAHGGRRGGTVFNKQVIIQCAVAHTTSTM